jgi:4-diphosphocytidyl-2-C-methyl-D-erythritol kinase
VTIALPARAKLNLDLVVTRRRSDGLHELRTRMQAVDLHDLLEVESSASTELDLTGLRVPDGKPNTVLAAHAALELAAGRPLPSRFRLHKRIPPGSGLGGASSDAAAALRALVSLHRLDVDIAPIAAHVGSDVPFFLTGGAALVEGAGEKVTRVAVDDRWFVIAWPGFEVSTAAVYNAWDDVGGDGPNALRRAAANVEPRVDEFAERLGAGWQMTGSGSAFFTSCDSREQAEAAARKLDCWTAVTRAAQAWA